MLLHWQKYWQKTDACKCLKTFTYKNMNSKKESKFRDMAVSECMVFTMIKLEH